MYAYSIHGSPIVHTKDSINALCAVQEDGFGLGADGVPTFEQHDGSNVDWNSQRTVVVRGQMIVVDEGEREWPFCAVVLTDKPLVDEIDEDDPDAGITELPADKVADARAAYADWKAGEPGRQPAGRVFVVDVPEGGFRTKESFDVEESRRLRPIAETLAMLDGNAFFGMDVDADGDDVHYRNYLPEAAALLEANGGWGSLASFIRKDAALPSNPMGLQPVRTVGGERIVDLVDAPTLILALTGIDWDTSDGNAEEMPEGLEPALPTDLIVGVDERAGDPKSGYEGLSDLLSDRYGYCVNLVAGVSPIERPVDA